MSRVLVTDGEQRAALAIVRSLGRAGHTVHVCSARSRSLAGVSRWAAGHARLPDPLREPEAFVHGLHGLVECEGIDVLIPVTEAALLAVHEHAAALGDVTVPFAGRDAFERARDKELVTRLAAELGVRVPRQLVLRDADRVRNVHGAGLDFPLVLKPARSVAGGHGNRRKTAVSHVADGDELRRTVAAIPPGAFPLLVQERITGDGIGAFLLLWDDAVLATFCHRRLREKPPSGGVSVYRTSVPPDRDLLDRSAALLAALRWQGPAMVEYKIDHATGGAYLMEVNGRFWGSLQLAIDAGVDFPALLVDACTGGRPDPVHRYRPDVRSRWFWGDVDHMIARMRHSPARLALQPGAPGLARVLGNFLAASFRRGDRGEVLRRNDPLPAVLETIDWIRRR